MAFEKFGVKEVADVHFYNTADGYCYFSDNFNSSNIVSTKTYKLIVIDYVYTYSYYKKYFKFS